MPLTLELHDILIRLGLAFLAGTLVGIDRTERGRPAGLRTVLLVTLAAAIAMIQANLLLTLGGKRPDSFIQLDAMRLPLGILTGVGFIGGGAILRKGDRVQGVTTAATLWFSTMIGLCFGAGMLQLGVIASLLGILILLCLRYFERFIHRDYDATLTIHFENSGINEQAIRSRLKNAGFEIDSWSVRSTPDGSLRDLTCGLRRHGGAHEPLTPPFVGELQQTPGIGEIEWCESHQL